MAVACRHDIHNRPTPLKTQPAGAVLATSHTNVLSCSPNIHKSSALLKTQPAGAVSARQEPSNIPVKPMAVSVQSTTCCCTAARIGERGLESVSDLPDLGLLKPSGKSGKGSSRGMASTAGHSASAGSYKCTSHGGAPLLHKTSAGTVVFDVMDSPWAMPAGW